MKVKVQVPEVVNLEAIAAINDLLYKTSAILAMMQNIELEFTSIADEDTYVLEQGTFSKGNLSFKDLVDGFARDCYESDCCLDWEKEILNSPTLYILCEYDQQAFIDALNSTVNSQVQVAINKGDTNYLGMYATRFNRWAILSPEVPF